MIPRRDSDFYKLKHQHQKVAYLCGMPKNFIQAPDKDPEFSNFKAHSKLITAAQQKKTFEGLLEYRPDNAHQAFWLSNPTDKPGLEAVCRILRKHAQAGFKTFEFISAHEDLRWDPEQRKDLYVIVGAHEDDVETTQRIRRWIRQPHGSAVWVVGVAKDPYKWASESVGVIPTYMFWLKRAGISVG